MVKGILKADIQLQKQTTWWWWSSKIDTVAKGSQVIGALHATDQDPRIYIDSRKFGWMNFFEKKNPHNFAVFGAGDNRKGHKCGGFKLAEMFLAYFTLSWAVRQEDWGYKWMTDPDEKLEVHQFPSVFQQGLRITAHPVGAGDHLGLIQARPRPFKHAPACPFLAFGSKTYTAKSNADKEQTWRAKFGQESEPSEPFTIFDTISTLGSVFSSSGETNSVKRFLVEMYIQAVGKVDMRTSFGIKGEWWDLDDNEQSGDQLEGVQPVPQVKPQLTPRKKVLHPRGVVASVKLVPSSSQAANEYTGLFKHGFKHGLIRLSNVRPATQPLTADCWQHQRSNLPPPPAMPPRQASQCLQQQRTNTANTANTATTLPACPRSPLPRTMQLKVFTESRGQTASSGILGVGAKSRELGSIVPGIALKAFVSRQKSLDMVAMRSLAGQSGEWNFFRYPFTTGIGAIPRQAVSTPFAAGFGDASACVTHVGFGSLARFKEDGSKVANAKSPYQLIFVPKTELAATVNSMVTEPRGSDGFLTCEDETQCPSTVSLLTRSIKKDVGLYDVYAVASPQDVRSVKPWGPTATGAASVQAIEVETLLNLQSNVESGKFVHIGAIVATSDGTASHVGDDHLFFKHQLFEDDALNEYCSSGIDWADGIDWSDDVNSRNAPSCTAGGLNAVSTTSHPRTITTGRAEFYCRMQKRAAAGAGGNHLGESCKEKIDALVSGKNIVCGKDPRVPS